MEGKTGKGTLIFYYENGKVEQEIKGTFKGESLTTANLKEGTITLYYENGNKRQEIKGTFDDEAKEIINEGTRIYYDEDGDKTRKDEGAFNLFGGEVIQGTTTFYHKNGNKRQKHKGFIEDFKERMITCYDKDGDKIEEIIIKDETEQKPMDVGMTPKEFLEEIIWRNQEEDEIHKVIRTIYFKNGNKKQEETKIRRNGELTKNTINFYNEDGTINSTETVL